MSNLVRAEFLKVFTTKAWWILALILFVYVGFSATIFAFIFGSVSNASAFPTTVKPINIILSLAGSSAYVFPLLLGILIVTAEYRTKTIVPTYLAAPARRSVLVAKSIVGLTMGAGFSLVSLAAALAVGGTILEIAQPGSFAHLDVWMALRVIGAVALWAGIGVGIGALIVNQIAAIVVALVFMQFLEPILRLVAGVWSWSKTVAQFLPGAASDSFVGVNALSGQTGAGDADTMQWWGGGLVLVAYVVVLMVLAGVTRVRADVN